MRRAVTKVCGNKLENKIHSFPKVSPISRKFVLINIDIYNTDISWMNQDSLNHAVKLHL